MRFKKLLPAILILSLLSTTYVFSQTQAEVEQMIFSPSKLSNDYKFNFPGSFEERNIKTKDGTMLSGLLFKANASKGLIFYLHGNSGALNGWGKEAPNYTDLNYDVFILDYRGFGKSEGKIENEEQFYSDIQDAYDNLKLSYPEKKTIILGYSIGTGPAAHLASRNNSQRLILLAPYYSMEDFFPRLVPDIDVSLIRYKFKTFEFIPKVKAPVVIFHGDADQTIYPGSSEKLMHLFKAGDQRFALEGVDHYGIGKSLAYLTELKNILK